MPLPEGRIFLANVGVNASHDPARSPLFEDGTFEWVPIPEHAEWHGPHSRRYCDLPQLQGPGSLADFVPASWRERAAHADPDFQGRTYGDECQRTARAHGLKRAEPGDWLLFLSRLHPWRAGAWYGKPVFSFVALLRISQIFHEIRSSPDDVSATLAKNAHFTRARNNPDGWDGFSVFVADGSGGRFRRACGVDRRVADTLLRDASGQRYAWASNRSDLQVIGSYTRTCRAILDPTLPRDRNRCERFWTIMSPYMDDIAE